MEETTTMTDIAGEMLNPLASGLAEAGTEESAQRPKPAETGNVSAGTDISEKWERVSAVPPAPEEKAFAAPSDPDFGGVKIDLDTGRREAVFPQHAREHRERREFGNYVNAWLRNPGDEGAACRAGYLMYRRLNPEAKATDVIEAMRSGVFGAGTDSPRNFANRLFEILGGNTDALGFADKIESGEVSLDEARAAVQENAGVQAALGGTRDEGRLHLADAFRRSVCDNETVKDWRWLKSEGFSAPEILAVFDAVSAMGNMDRHTATVAFPQILRRHGIASGRASDVLQAVMQRLPEREASWLERYSSRTGDAVLGSFDDFLNAMKLGGIEDSYVKRFSNVLESGVATKSDFMRLRQTPAAPKLRNGIIEEAKKRGAELPDMWGKGDLDERSGRILAEVMRERLRDERETLRSRAAVLNGYQQKFIAGSAIGDWTADNLGAIEENLAWLGGTVLTSGALLPAMIARYGMADYGTTFNEAIAGGADVSRADTGAKVAAVVSGALEMVPAERLLGVAARAVPGLSRGLSHAGARTFGKSLSEVTNSELAELFVPKSLFGKIRREAGSLAGTVVSEGATEILQNMTTSGAAQWAIDGDLETGIVEGLEESVSGESGRDLFGQVLAISLGGHMMARGVRRAHHLRDVEAAVKLSGQNPASRAEAEQIWVAAMKGAFAQRETLDVMAAIDSAADRQAFGNDGKLTGDMQSFVHSVMLPGTDAEGNTHEGYSRHWDTAKKKTFLKERNGGHSVPAQMRKAFDLLDAASEVAGEQVKYAQERLREAKTEELRAAVLNNLNESGDSERHSAAAMNRTGTIPDEKMPQQVFEGIEANSSVAVSGTLSDEIRRAADSWSQSGKTQDRRRLAGALLNAIPAAQRAVKLKDGRTVEITANGIADILQHMPNTKGAFRDGALEFIQRLPAFLASAEEFYRETKGTEHNSFGGVVDFNGTSFYVSVTCTVSGDSLRVKAVNSIKKSSLEARTEATASGKRKSSAESVSKTATKLDTADVLKWIVENQDKSGADFEAFIRGAAAGRAAIANGEQAGKPAISNGESQIPNEGAQERDSRTGKAQDGTEESGTGVLSREHLGELVKRFLSEGRAMGEGSIEAELRAAFLDEPSAGADAKVVSALQGLAQRCGSAFEFLSFLDAYASSCESELSTRTKADMRAARVNYFGLRHVGTAARPDTNYERFVRSAYFSQRANRRRLKELTPAQRSRLENLLGGILGGGSRIQIGGVPAWASEKTKAQIARGEVNGLYSEGRVWISEDSYAGTGLHEAVWHGTWAWAKKHSPELYAKMREYALRAPSWLREMIAEEYAGNKSAGYEEISDEIGAYLFENEFEGDFLKELDSESRSWWRGLRQTFMRVWSKLRGRSGLAEDAHDAVRELMERISDEGVRAEGLENGEQADAKSIAISNSESQMANEGTAGTSGDERDSRDEARKAYARNADGERYSAAAMNRTGSIPGGKVPRQVAEKIFSTSPKEFSTEIPEEVSESLKKWLAEKTAAARATLSAKIFSNIPEKKIILPNGETFAITANGIESVLAHMKINNLSVVRGRIAFLLGIADFAKSAEDFYEETKGVRHISFARRAKYEGRSFFATMTLSEVNKQLRLKDINAFLEKELSAPESAGATSENQKRSISENSVALNVKDTLKWIIENQDKSRDAFNEFLRGSTDLRHSRVYGSVRTDAQEAELYRMADACARAARMLLAGKMQVPQTEAERRLPEWERAAVISRAETLYRVAKAQGAGTFEDAASAAEAAIKANRAVLDRYVYATAFDAVANGTEVERGARARIRDELSRMESRRKKNAGTLPADLSEESKALAEELRRAQGARSAMRKSAATLEERSRVFMSAVREAGEQRGLKDADAAGVLAAVISDAEKAALPAEHLAKLRELIEEISERGNAFFEEESDAAKVKRAEAADLLTETETALGILKEMLKSGVSSVKDRAVVSKAESENTGAQRAEAAAEDAFFGDDPSVVARRAGTSVLLNAWRKTVRSLGVSGLDIGSFGEESAAAPASVLKLIALTAQERAAALEAEADELGKALENGTFMPEERKSRNAKRNALREDAARIRDAVSGAGMLTEAFKQDAEALAKRMMERSGNARAATAIAALRDAVTLSQAVARAYALFMTASRAEAEASLPYLKGRLRGLLFSLPKLDERTDDDSSYYTPEYRVFANQLREVGREWWDRSFEEVQAEIDRLESAETRDDHANARLRALEMVGGAKNMSAEMLDRAFWTILSERDTAFLDQTTGKREQRAETAAGAKAFLRALAKNPHAKPVRKGVGQDIGEQGSSQGGFSLGDRLRGWIKHAKGADWEAARAFADAFEQRFSDAASAHDRLAVAQHDWMKRTMREIFGSAWQSRVSRLSTVELPELAKFDHTSNADVKTSGLSAMHALHLYMSARQKSFQAPLLNPTAFSEESRGALISRQKYVEQAKDGGELERFLKSYDGGVLWKLKEAWNARWKELFPRLNEAYRSVYGFDMYDPFGETEYYPLKLKSDARSGAQGKIARTGAVMLPVSRRFQSRTVNVAELDANRKFAEVVFEQMEDTLHTIAYAEAHRDAERFMGNAEVRDVMNARVSSKDLKGFADHLADTLAMPSQLPDGDRTGKLVAGTAAVLALGANIFTPIRQITGGGTYFAESPFGVGATTAAMFYPVWGTLWGGQYLGDVLRVVRDPLFRARYEESARIIEQAAMRGKGGHGAAGAVGRFFLRLRNASMWGVKFGDAVPIATAGVGFYRMYYAQNLRRGMTDEQAHERAMNDMMALTEKTQQTRRMMNKTALQRSEWTGAKLISQFKSMNDQALGNEARAVSDLAAGLKSGKRWAKAARSVVAYHLLFGAFSDFVMQSVFIALSGNDDDEESFWERLNLWELGAAAGFGGLYGSTAAFLAFDAFGLSREFSGGYYSDSPWGMSLPSVSILVKAGKQVGKGGKALFDDDKDMQDAFLEFLKASGGGRALLRVCDRLIGEDDE